MNRQEIHAREVAMVRVRSRLLLLFLAVLLAGACSRPRPSPAPPVSSSPSPTAGSPTASSPGSTSPTVDLPVLSLRVDPSQITRGESALLTWESRNANNIDIEPGIGRVDPSGRIRFFPDVTSRYDVTATGPGGSVTQSVTVEVLSAGAGIVAADVADDSLQARFQREVRPVFFAFDSAELDDEGRRTLQINAEWLLHPENLSVELVIEGHCDERGSEEYNLALGDRRAQVAFRFLATAGVEQNRLVAVSLGEERPFARGDAERDFALNRRVQFVLIEQAAPAAQPEP